MSHGAGAGQVRGETWIRAYCEARFAMSDESDLCWEWQGTITKNGYGQAKCGRRTYRAHRLVYELQVRPLEPDEQLDHLCRNRRCVRPSHLEPVSTKVNVLRGIGITAMNAQKGACVKGHPFDQDNTRITPAGERSCRACNRQDSARYRRQNPEKVREGWRDWAARERREKPEQYRARKQRSRAKAAR